MAGGKKAKGCSDAQLQALARYHEKNRDELLRKARERMELQEEYQSKARKDSARFREAHGAILRLKAVVRRDKASIAKIGYDKWYDGYRKRHPSPLPTPLPDDVPSPDDPQPEPTEPPCTAPDVPEDRETLEDYETRINHWLDHLDPTTAPDYVPSPGQKLFFQRGKQRWY
ncbi:hypothetical protein B0H13DRAFT_1875526 [Mycena leptocephala]|nr:hypothetical protein B0H13DRAFT_1875526 [Mycena leptocephala]